MTSADENPFRVQRIEALRFRAPDFAWDVFLAQLATRNCCGAIVGPRGSGKTTLLLELQQRFEAQGIPVYYGFLNEAIPRKRRVVLGFLRKIPRNAVLFLDGAEQLDPFTWQWLRWRARRLRGFIVTTHEPGYLTTLYSTVPTELILRELLAQLAPEEADRWWPQAQTCFQQHNGNIREVFFALYDACVRSDP